MRLINGLTLAFAFLTFSPGMAIACEGAKSASMSEAKIKVATIATEPSSQTSSEIAAKIVATEKAKQALRPGDQLVSRAKVGGYLITENSWNVTCPFGNGAIRPPVQSAFQRKPSRFRGKKSRQHYYNVTRQIISFHADLAGSYCDR